MSANLTHHSHMLFFFHSVFWKWASYWVIWEADSLPNWILSLYPSPMDNCHPAAGWWGQSPGWEWLSSLFLDTFFALLCLWYGASQLLFLQLDFLLLLGPIQQKFHLEVKGSSDEVPKTNFFHYDGSQKHEYLVQHFLSSQQEIIWGI